MRPSRATAQATCRSGRSRPSGRLGFQRDAVPTVAHPVRTRTPNPAATTSSSGNRPVGLVVLNVHRASALHASLVVVGSEHDRHSDHHHDHHEHPEPAQVAALGWLIAHEPKIAPPQRRFLHQRAALQQRLATVMHRQAGVGQERVGQLWGLTDSLRPRAGPCRCPMQPRPGVRHVADVRTPRQGGAWTARNSVSSPSSTRALMCVFASSCSRSPATLPRPRTPSRRRTRGRRCAGRGCAPTTPRRRGCGGWRCAWRR